VRLIAQRQLSRLFLRLHQAESLPSTNTTVKEMAAAGAAEGFCVIADEQTAGRGRRDRTWISPRGEGLYLSVLLRPTFASAVAPLLSLLGGVAVAQTLASFPKLAPRRIDIKWPNDVTVNDKKISGALTEAAFSGEKIAYAVLGVGVNILQRTFPETLSYPATSILLEGGAGACLDRLEVAMRILEALDDGYAKMERDPKSVVSCWERMSSYANGKSVCIQANLTTIVGVTCGMNDNGALLVRCADGTVQSVSLGDVLSAR
jgi:BirA family transcriptional regulator, biotin operon repressor / biotin---[acetyl-CoA-carboxylase] ligase